MPVSRLRQSLINTQVCDTRDVRFIFCPEPVILNERLFSHWFDRRDIAVVKSVEPSPKEENLNLNSKH